MISLINFTPFFFLQILFFADHLNVRGDAAIKETLLEHKGT